MNLATTQPASAAASLDKVPNLMFSHMGFAVSDMPKMEDFYSRVLGFTVTDRGEVLGWIWYFCHAIQWITTKWSWSQAAPTTFHPIHFIRP